nr:MAG TPA: hypothetical protein [Caudoviricetes sp.]
MSIRMIRMRRWKSQIHIQKILNGLKIIQLRIVWSQIEIINEE